MNGYVLAADALLIIHTLFVVFVVAGLVLERVRVSQFGVECLFLCVCSIQLLNLQLHLSILAAQRVLRASQLLHRPRSFLFRLAQQALHFRFVFRLQTTYF